MESLDKEVSEVNKKLHAHERLSAMVIVKEDWSDENKMLTPTLKIRRNAINEKYQSQIEAWCSDNACVIFEN